MPICRPAQVLGHNGWKDDQFRLLHAQDSMVRQEETVGNVYRDPGFFSSSAAVTRWKLVTGEYLGPWTGTHEYPGGIAVF